MMHFLHKQKQKGQWMLLFLLLVLTGSGALAQTGGGINFKKVLDGSKGQLAKDSSITIQDTAFFSPTLQNKLEAGYKVTNIVTFKINEYAPLYLPPQFTATAKVRVYYLNAHQTIDSIAEKALVINYDTAKAYSVRSSLVFHDAHQVTVKILELTSSIPGITAALMIENELQAQPVYKLSCTDDAVKEIQLDETGNVDDADEIRVSWPITVGADEYDLEWAYIDSSALKRYGTPPQAALIFDGNASRVTINDNAYSIPLLYDNGGILFVRVRAVQDKASNARMETDWSSDFPEGLGSFSFIGHQRKLNWQSEVSYAEDGKRKAVVQYFDGSLRNRQTVTKDNTTGTTVVGESFYDYQGRPVIQVLPAPTLNTIIKYSRDFNTTVNGAEYDKDQYDHLATPADFLSASAAKMSANTGASQYYSPNNPERENGPNRFIPDAGGYPFSETSYTQDNTGRISRQGGVGPAYKLGGNHESKYYYGSPGDNDLDVLFGTEAGDKTHYFKNMVRDANGQFSVSYVDMHGRTIATALAGMPDAANMDPLPSYSVFTNTDILSKPGSNVIKEMVMESHQSQVVPLESDYDFRYTLTPPVLQKGVCDPNGNPICYSGLYDLEITITDDSYNQLLGGQPVKKQVFNYQRGNIQMGDCGDARPSFDVAFTVHLPKGSYEITKRLTISQEGLDYYRDNVFLPANLCKTLDDFIQQQRDLVVNMQCEPTCDACKANIGTLDDFRSRYFSATGETSDAEARIAYQSAMENCDALCDKTTEADDIRKAMLADVTPPSGQYANVDNQEDPYSIFYADGVNPRPYQRLNLIYRDEAGIPDFVHDDVANIDMIPSSLDMDRFAANFKSSWAETALTLHPEYCKLQELEKHTSSYNWDKLFQSVDTYAEAKAKGYLNPTANTTELPFIGYPAVPENRDSLAMENEDMRIMLESKLAGYEDVNGYSMWSVAVVGVKCKQSEIACANQYAIGATAFDEGSLCEGELDMAWRAFRELYLQNKRDIINELVEQACSSAPKASDLTADHKQPRFNNTNETLGQQGIGYLNNSNPTAAQNAANQALLQSFEDNCKAYAKFWLQQVAPCQYNSEAWEEIELKLIQVCKEGSDIDHPYGSSTVKPGSTYQYKSFEDVLNEYNAQHPTNPLVCNGFMITSPKPYNKQPVYTDRFSYTKPADCECGNLQGLQREYTANKIAADVDLSAYLLRTRQINIKPSDLQALIDACNNNAAGCTYLTTPITVPAWIQCNVAPPCATCLAVDSLYDEYAERYPTALPSPIVTDDVQLQKNQLFANYMNSRLGFNKVAVDYLQFRDSCTKVDITTSQVCVSGRVIRSYATEQGGTSFARVNVSDPSSSIPQVDEFRDVLQTSIGDYLMAGSTTGNGQGGKDATVIRVGLNGAYIWAKTYGGAADDEFVRIKRSPAGGYIAIGSTKSYNASSVQDILIVKLDESGNVEWSENVGFATGGGEKGMDIIPLSDGGYVFAGGYNYQPGGADWVVGKLNAQGAVGWVRRLGTGGSDPTISLLEDGEMIIAAATANYTGATHYDGAVIKMNKSNGTVISKKGYELDNRSNWFGNIYKTETGYKINVLNADAWEDEDGTGAVLDIDNSGEVLSAKAITPPASSEVGWLPIFYAADGSVIASQALASAPQSIDIFLHRINPGNTSLNWSNRIQLAGKQALNAVIQNANGGIVGVGIADNRALFVMTDGGGETGCNDLPLSPAFSTINASKKDFSFSADAALTFTTHFLNITAGLTVLNENVSCQQLDSCYTIYNGPLLCGNASPVFPPVTEVINNCSDNDFFAISTGTELYNAYRDSIRNTFDKDYIKTAQQAASLEDFRVTYNTSEYHYTLYYYDQAGNLVKTIPPVGVVVDRSQQWLDDVKSARANSLQKVPPHTMATEYHYNTLNLVTEQQTPDAGFSKFWYDRLGRLVISQNAKQATQQAYSYTNYDPLGRIIEVGEITSNAPMSDATSRSDDLLSGWLATAANTKTQITRTGYDKPYTPLEGDDDGHALVATNLRNRVAWSAIYDTKADIDNSNNFSAATFYSYDIHGNVDTLVQDFKKSILRDVDSRWRKIVYRYDLISGKVNHVAYQPGQADAFYHRYSYDAENRLTNVETSYDSVYWENDAFYQYYKHGPLARTVLGQQQVQGLDYAYTLQGWLKGVNSTALTPTFDMGADGGSGSIVAKDAFGFALHYFGANDYTPIKNTVKPFAEGGDAQGFRPLFNGNISAMSVHLPSLGAPLLYAYNYDVLNRLKAMNAQRNLNTTTNTWTPSVLEDFRENVTYDANGNIITYQRNGNNTFAGKPIQMDNLSYYYKAGKNQLDFINDAVDSLNYDNDIDRQQVSNYEYDAIGNLTKDVKEGISNIEWTVYGKIRKITKANGTIISYTYDAAGNRISKDVNGKQTWYVRDATSNIMSVYTYGDASVNNGDLTRTETNLYGSSRLGMSTLYTNLQHKVAPELIGPVNGINIIFTRGNKVFELSNHLGNVLATVADEKKAVSVDGSSIDHYEARLTSAQDYYPFGMLMPGRNGHQVAGGWAADNSVINGHGVPESLTINSRSGNQPGEYVASRTIGFTEGFDSGVNDNFNATIADGGYNGGSATTGDGAGGSTALSGYRYGFNGKENDNDVKGEGNQQDYGMRVYDPRLGRFLSVDPLTPKYPELTPYQFASNRPVDATDLDGLEALPAAEGASAPAMRPIIGGLRTPMPMAPYTRYGVSPAGAAYEENPLSTIEQIKQAEEHRREEYLLNNVMIGGKWVPRFEDEARELRTRMDIRKINKYYANLKSPLSGFIGTVPTFGSGPASGVFSLSAASKSAKAIANYYPSGRGKYVEFVFDIKTEVFAVGKPNYSTSLPGLSPHQKLANLIDGDHNTLIGGMFSRDTDGAIHLSDNSGHFYQNWTLEKADKVKEFLESRTGLPVKISFTFRTPPAK